MLKRRSAQCARGTRTKNIEKLCKHEENDMVLRKTQGVFSCSCCWAFHRKFFHEERSATLSTRSSSLTAQAFSASSSNSHVSVSGTAALRSSATRASSSHPARSFTKVPKASGLQRLVLSASGVSFAG